MLKQFSDINYILGSEKTINAMASTPNLPIFSDSVITFLDNFSKYILKDSEAKEFPDIVTFAFWCRKASILKMKKDYLTASNRIGKGIVFHIAPSNVPINFAYSLVSSLLSGNKNIVRVPSKDYDQTRIVSHALGEALALSPLLNNYICLIQYPHSKEINDYLSALCQVRVIWGGDSTISTFRNSPLPPRSTEILFANRFSFSIINADDYLAMENKEKIAENFYNDTFLSDQNACNSPKLVAWIGNNIQAAKLAFWKHFDTLVQKKYDIKPIQVTNKYLDFCKLATNFPSVRLLPSQNNLITRISTSTLEKDILVHTGNSGFFLEIDIEDLDQLLPITDIRCQTISFCGNICDDIVTWVVNSGLDGVDRIVPLGETMSFSLIWDGYDLISSLSRVVSTLY